jgi:hypothetical protein
MGLKGPRVDFLRSKSAWADAIRDEPGAFFKALSVDENGAVW